MLYVFTYKELISESLSNLLRATEVANLERLIGEQSLEKETQIKSQFTCSVTIKMIKV